MDVGGHAFFRHLLDDLVPLFNGDAGNADQIQMVGAVHAQHVMNHMGDAQFIADGVVFLHHLLSSAKHAGIAVQLAQADGCHDVRHVALVPGPDDVIFPGAHLGLGQSILVLAVKGEQLIHLVDFRVVNALQRQPGAGAALRGGEVLHSMEAEAGKVRDGAYVAGSRFRLARACALDHAAGAQGVGRVRHHRHPAQGVLDPAGQVVQQIGMIVQGREQITLTLHDLEDPVVVADHTAQVHGDDGLGLFCDCLFQGVIIHFRAVGDGIPVLLDIHKFHSGAAVDGRGSGSGVGVGRDDDLIPGTDAQDPEVQLLRCGGAVQADHPVLPAICVRFSIHVVLAGFNIGGQPPFQELGPGAGGDPAAAHGFRNFPDFRFADVGRAEGDRPLVHGLPILGIIPHLGEVVRISLEGEIAGVVPQGDSFLLADVMDLFPDFRGQLRVGQEEAFHIMAGDGFLDLLGAVDGQAVHDLAGIQVVNHANRLEGHAVVQQGEHISGIVPTSQHRGTGSLLAHPVLLHDQQAVGKTDGRNHDKLQEGADHVIGDGHPADKDQGSCHHEQR